MRKLLAIGAVLAILPYANADETVWSWDGDVRLRFETHEDPISGSNINNASDKFIEQRNIVGVNMKRGDSVSGRVTLIHAFNWGSVGAGNVNDEINSNGGAIGAVGRPNGLNNTENLLLVNEAYLDWNFAHNWSLRAGRTGFELANGKVISRFGDALTPYSFDGVRIGWDHNIAHFGINHLRLSDGFSATGSTAAANNLTGEFTNDPQDVLTVLSADFKGLPDWWKVAHIHVIQRTADETTGVNTAGVGTTSTVDEKRFGLVASGDTHGLDFSFTYAMVFGETENRSAATAAVDNEANMWDLELGYSLPEVANLRVHFNYHVDSGDDGSDATSNETYNPLFYDQHNNAGRMDVVAWGNLTYWNLGVTASYWGLDFAVEYYQFTKTEDQDATLNQGVHGALLANSGGNGVAADEDDIGTELDIVISKAYDNGMNVGFRYGMFTPGDLFSGTDNRDETYSQYVVEAGMTF